MPSADPSVYIIILNWNNAEDTCECLESIQHLNYSNFFTILIDNGSTDDSIKKIQLWAEGRIPIDSRFIPEHSIGNKPVDIINFSAVDVHSNHSSITTGQKLLTAAQRIILIRSQENLGFAKGC